MERVERARTCDAIPSFETRPGQVTFRLETGRLGTTTISATTRTDTNMRALLLLLGLLVLCPAFPVPEEAEPVGVAVEDKVQQPFEFKEAPKEGADSAFQTMLDSEDSAKDEKESAAVVEQLSAILEFAKYDTNKDGFIDLGEWSNIHGGIEKFEAHFHSADIDGKFYVSRNIKFCGLQRPLQNVWGISIGTP